MFKKFYAQRATVTPDRAYVKDSRTHKVIYTGTREACDKYRNAFGHCYVEAF